MNETPIQHKLAKQIRKLRLKAGLTQEEVAERLDMSTRYYQQLESSKPGDMQVSTVAKIAKALTIPIWKLFKF